MDNNFKYSLMQITSFDTKMKSHFIKNVLEHIAQNPKGCRAARGQGAAAARQVPDGTKLYLIHLEIVCITKELCGPRRI